MFYQFKDQDGYEIIANMDNIIYTRITSQDSVLLIDVNGTTKPFTGVDIKNLKSVLANKTVDTPTLLVENTPVERESVSVSQSQEIPEKRGPGRPKKF